MKILMMTNTYAPMVGGIEESIRSFTSEFERLGHEVVIVAPQCADAPPDEVGVVRLRAIQHFNHSDFSMALPMSSLLPELMKTFMPDIVHSHHPFWMGDIALRLCSQNRIPLVFTYHTMFEQHMHYLPIQNEGIKRFIVELFSGYANLANQVVVPSASVRAILLERGVKAPMAVVPTGVDLNRFARGEGQVIRRRLGIPDNAVVIGTVGRLAVEKNLEFLSRCIAGYLKADSRAHFLVAGEGPLLAKMKNIFGEAGVQKRLHCAGVLKDQDLVDGYHAMQVFAFASLSETQGIVLTEAMAVGVPVVAIDAPGVREVVKDGYNGRLLFEENEKNFREALYWCLNQSPGQFAQLRQNARATTREFAVAICAQKMLTIYQEVRSKEYTPLNHQESPWFALGDRLKNEWDMFKNMLQAGGAAMLDTVIVKPPSSPPRRGMLAYLPRLLSLSEWSARLLRLLPVEGVETQPGLVLIQIDGLSQKQFQAGLSKNEMPFLNNLIKNKYYRLYPHYPGLPSSTPSVQGELFYGVKQIVPAFAFFDFKFRKIFRLYDSAAVIEIERRLSGRGPGLLAGGSSYSNIFSGGAAESHFCAAILGWNQIWKMFHPLSFLVFCLTHLLAFLRILFLIVWEIVLGIVDFGRGIFQPGNMQNELNYIYLRALLCIFLRELVIIGVKLDIARGLEIIHLNFAGYDEQAHNAGPSSTSAHWALPGIDRAIEKIYRKAVHATRRSYDVWIYSDHGQEDTFSYTTQYGRTVQEAVAEIYKKFNASADAARWADKTGVQLQRARFLGLPFIEFFFNSKKTSPEYALDNKLVVTAIGPTGNIYLPQPLSGEERERFARELVRQAHIPLVLAPHESNAARVWTSDGEYVLPQAAAKVLGAQHPYLAQVAEDMIRVCQHADAGDFTFMGFRPDAPQMTFPQEKGSHAGPGQEETNAFALLPIDVIKLPAERTYLTPLDLRNAALRFLKRPAAMEQNAYPEIFFTRENKPHPDSAAKTYRVMTYNVRSCVGLDGKIFPQRIARVIGRHEPDIVALQELDFHRQRTKGEDQTHIIARQLEMIYHFHPVIQVAEERYGDAVLSRYPLKLIRAGRFPKHINYPRAEPRGAIWTAVNLDGIKINFFNTHLGLLPREGREQAKALLGQEWLCHPVCQGPIILCGDFNALPSSQLCRDIKGPLRDAQEELQNFSPAPTWFGHYPFARIDHIFISPEIEVAGVDVSRTDLDKMASDHLPLIVDFKLRS
ncbi:MAG: glycosyltransferase [Candidatus Omnitrophica bacterium]|nr:glycosyltransferase [Candidatus Omnitrophota bacterium]